jgi:hypothetical protein
MVTTATTPPSPQERLDKLRRELETLRARSVRSTWATLILGTLVLSALAVYFFIGYSRITAAAEPEMLVAAADAVVSDRLPQARQGLADEIKKAAPDLAASASKHLQGAIPDARKRLEVHALDQIDETLKESELLSQKQFTDYLRANRPALERKFRELSASDTLAEQSLEELSLSFDAQLAPDLKAKAQESIHVLMAMNDKLARLQANKGLSPDEQVERRILMSVRRLQTEQGEPAVASAVQQVGTLAPSK